jgi:hypothetical protein
MLGIALDAFMCVISLSLQTETQSRNLSKVIFTLWSYIQYVNFFSFKYTEWHFRHHPSEREGPRGETLGASPTVL